MSTPSEMRVWLDRLEAADPAAQADVVEAWARFPKASDPAAAPVWQAVERLALRGETPEVRRAAMRALSSPAAQAFYAARARQPLYQRREMRAEIQTWLREGLITPEQAAVLIARYADPPPRRPKRSSSPETEAQRASPWALYVVLYLGAFFVIAAALLLATAVRAWRLPILLAATGFFALGAVGVYRFMPHGGRVLGVVAAGFLWADAIVLGDMLEPHLSMDDRALYWAVAFSVLALAWLVGAWYLRIGVLHLAAWPMGAVAAANMLIWLDRRFGLPVPSTWFTLAWAGLLLVLLGWIRLLRHRQPRTAMWLLGLGHGAALALLLLGIPLASLDVDVASRWAQWGGALGAYLLVLAFYVLARWWVRPVPWLESWTVPLTVAGIMYAWTHLWSAGWPQAVALMLASAGVALVAWLLERRPGTMARVWAVGLEGIAGLGWWLAGVLFWENDGWETWVRAWWALIPWLLGAAWGWGMALAARRWVPAVWGWLLALIGFVHFVMHIWPASLDVYWPGWLLIPLLGSVLLDALGHHLKVAAVKWVARIGGFMLVFNIGGVLLARLGRSDLRDVGVWAALTLLWVGYTLATRHGWLWGGVPPLVALTWGVLLDALNVYHPVLLSVWPVLAALMVWIAARRPARGWQAWGWGTLLVAGVTSLLAFMYDDGWSVLTLAMMATVVGGFAWLWEHVFLALPAAWLYFAAYAWTLHLWDVHQPQAYTIPAAALGLLLHGLYRRRGHRVVAFVLGVLSQLVLFTTTYIQMVDHRSGWYFAMLFLQALVVAGYGLWSNDAALIWTPIGFVVLATVTMLLIRFQGLGVLTLLCISGLVLLVGGLFFLWRRARADTQASSSAVEGE